MVKKSQMVIKFDSNTLVQLVSFAFTIYFVVMAALGLENKDNVSEFEKGEWKFFFAIIMIFALLQLLFVVMAFLK